MSAEWQYEQICYPQYNYFFKTFLLSKKLDINKHAGKTVNANKETSIKWVMILQN